MNMKIGILGGAFDPPHLGHLIVSMEIKEYLHLDEMWLMPVFSHAFDKKLSPVHHRRIQRTTEKQRA
jgi:nicotinate-nucleotide adenylyltransferase